jgi:hypothetical protein
MLDCFWAGFAPRVRVQLLHQVLFEEKVLAGEWDEVERYLSGCKPFF